MFQRLKDVTTHLFDEEDGWGFEVGLVLTVVVGVPAFAGVITLIQLALGV